MLLEEKDLVDENGTFFVLIYFHLLATTSFSLNIFDVQLL